MLGVRDRIRTESKRTEVAVGKASRSGNGQGIQHVDRTVDKADRVWNGGRVPTSAAWDVHRQVGQMTW